MSIILSDIQQAYYTAAQWTSWNGVLLAGQKGIESDTLKEKVGDGVTAWISLAYSSIPAQSLSNVLGVGNTTGANDIVATNNSKYRNSDGSVNLNISNSALIDFTNTDGLYTYSLDSDATSQYIQMRSYDNATTLELAYLQTFYQQVNMGVYSASTGGKLTQLEITNGEIRTNIVNNAAFEGIKYGADYSANYTNRSLVDKGYVTGNFQPLDADLTSWAAITRASGFDTFVATPSSANLRSLVSDETGSGALVFGTSPTFTTQITVQGDIIADQSTSAVYLGNITPSSTNYALKYTAANEISLNAPTTLRFRCGGTLFATGSSTDLTINGTAGLSIANNANDTKITFSRTSGNTHSIQLTTADYYLYNNTAAAIRYGVTNAGNFYVGAKSALATTATDGFLYVPSCAGVPTGIPTAITGKIPIVVDSTNNKMYIYSGGAWVALN